MNEEKPEPGRYRRILFCTDFSDNADFAFRYAVDAARRRPGCILYLLHVIPEPEAQFWKTYIYEVEDIDNKARHDIDAKIAATYRPLLPDGLDFRVEMMVGRDYIRILEFAEAMNVDLIILGRHGHSAFGKLLFGNVTEKVARHANCPVMIVPLSFQQKVTNKQN